MAVHEHLQIDYDYLIEYLEDPQNAIGATTSILRNITAHSDGNSIYIRKFGTDYLIKEVTDIEDPIDANMSFKVISENGTVLGERTGGGAFSAGSVLAEAESCYMEIEADGGNVVVLAGIDVDTDVDPGGYTFVCAAETIQDGDILTLYLSDSGSTYYDPEYMYGGARHVPDSTSRLPYPDITTAIADPDVTGFTICTVLDSETYDEQFSISIAGMILQADDGQTPINTSGVGARVTREVSVQYNNITAIYFNKSGDDANSGTWQEPKVTLGNAIASRAGKSVIYGGSDADDAALFEGQNSIVSGIIEADYGYLPRLYFDGTNVAAFIISVNGAGAGIRGFECEGPGGIVPWRGIKYKDTAIVYDCTVFNCNYAIMPEQPPLVTGTIVRCLVYNAVIGIWGLGSTIEDCIVRNCDTGIRAGFTSTISNSITYDCIYGINAYGAALTADNLTVFNCSENGINSGGTGALIINNSIFHSNVIGANHSAGSITCNSCNWTNNTTDRVGTVTNNSEVIGDGSLCWTSTPYKLGLSGDSVGHRAGNTSDDIGALLRIVEINESNIEINGITLDGQEQYNNAVYILDAVDHTGTVLKWNSIYDFQGIAIDPYDDDADTDVTISNCKIHNNGNGIKLSYGGNTVENNLIYRNSDFGIHSNHVGQTFNHNVFYGNQYGLYLESNSSGIIFKNNITHSNSILGIFSEIAIAINHCCVTDGTSNVDTSHESNFIDDPLLLNEDVGDEDFNIKTRFGGFNIDSPCYLASDDDTAKDVGAFDVTRSIAEEAWKKYVLYSNPSNMNIDQDAPGEVKFTDALGSRSLWAKAHKLAFPLQWDENVATDEEQKDKIKYFSTIIQKREGRSPRTKQQARIRLRIKPDGHLLDGTNGIVDAANKIMTDTNNLLTEDKFKGYNAALIFASGTGMVIDAVAKTGTKAGAGWEVNQWRGYYKKYNGYTYFIKSNTATVLTLSDPYSTLISATIDYSIEKYFEIEEHDNAGIFYLLDDDSELVDGTYNYYFDFALTRVQSSKFRYVQPKFAFDRPEWMSGYSLSLEQI